MIGVHDSLKKNDQMSITMLTISNKVVRINRDPDSLLVNYGLLMQLELDEGQNATDAFVFDGMVAVRINDDRFRFFIEPLVKSATVWPLEDLPKSGFQD